MRYLTAGICALFAAGSLASASGQEAAAPQPGKLITVEVVVADVSEGAGAVPTAAAILELEKAGKLSGVARYRLTGLDNQPASIQFGELASLATGRTVTRGGGEFGGRGGAGGFGGQTTFNQLSVGTHVTAASRVESADSILTDLKIQRSSVVPPQPAADAADPNAFVPQGTLTFNMQATVRCKPGEPLLVTGRQMRSGKEATQTWVVVTASIAAGAPAEKRAGVSDGPDEQLQVFQLVNGSAPAMANVLTGIFPRNTVRIAVDERTNSLVLRGTPEQIEIARALTLRLDVEKK